MNARRDKNGRREPAAYGGGLLTAPFATEAQRDRLWKARERWDTIDFSRGIWRLDWERLDPDVVDRAAALSADRMRALAYGVLSLVFGVVVVLVVSQVVLTWKHS